ncbi:MULTISPECIES: ester cyclase [unclassified Geodermatophilus]
MTATAPADALAAGREIMRRNIQELFAPGDAALIPELYAADVVDHNPVPGQRPGHDGLRDVLEVFHRAFPDQEMELLFTLADGDLAMDHWVFRGTHTGDLDGVPATGRRVEFRGFDLARIRDGRIAEIWHVEDMAAMWADLGLPGGPR